MNFDLLKEVKTINESQKEMFVAKVRSELWTLRGKRLAALGLPFKGDTDDIRESPAIDVIRDLLEAGATVTAYDPAAMDRAREVLPPSKKLHYASVGLTRLRKTPDRAGSDPDRLEGVCQTRPWPRLWGEAVRFPIVIDGRNLYKPATMLESGFTYVSVGRPAIYHELQNEERKMA